MSELNKRVVLCQGFVNQYKPIRKLWASITPLKGEAHFFAGQERPEVSHLIKVRYRQSISTEMIFTRKGRKFRIEYLIDEDEAKETLLCYCKEGDS